MSQTNTANSRLFNCCVFRSSFFGAQESIGIAMTDWEGIRFYDSNFKCRVKMTGFGAVGRIAVGNGDVFVFTGRQQMRPQTSSDGTNFFSLDPSGVAGVPFEKDKPHLNHGPRCVRFARLTEDGDVKDDLAELCFQTNVCGLRMNNTGYVAVVLETKTLIYDVKEVLEKSEEQRRKEAEKRIRRRRQTIVDPVLEIETGLNFRGVVAMTECGGRDDDDFYVAVPGEEIGHVIIASVKEKTKKTYHLLYDQLAAAEFSRDKQWLFIMSETGRFCRVINVKEGINVKILVRGKDAALPFVPCVSDDARFLTICSEKGTRHVYALDQDEWTKTLEEEMKKKASSASAPKTASGKAVEGGGDEALATIKIEEEEEEMFNEMPPAAEESKPSGLWEWTKAAAYAGVKFVSDTASKAAEYLWKNYNVELKEPVGEKTYVVCGFSPRNYIFVASSDGHLLRYRYSDSKFSLDDSITI